VVILGSESFLRCRYCGHRFKESDIPKTYPQEVYDQVAQQFEVVEFHYNHRRCPSCLHVLDYSVDLHLPPNFTVRLPEKMTIVSKMQYRVNPDSGVFEFANEKVFLRKELKR
jgi:hypothetical protein